MPRTSILTRGGFRLNPWLAAGPQSIQTNLPEIARKQEEIIKKDAVHGGVLQFGTELVTASDGSIVAMLGASPGASTAVWIMLQVIERSFRQNLATEGWAQKLRDMIPSYGQSLIENPALVQRLRAETAAILQIKDINTKEKENDSRISAVHGD